MEEVKTKNQKDRIKELEAFLDKLTTHPLFLESVSTMLNLNSYRKIFLKRSLQQIWKTLELPNKRDQEKTLYLVSELQFKIQQLEKQLAQAQAPQAKEDSLPDHPLTPKPKKTILTALQ